MSAVTEEPQEVKPKKPKCYIKKVFETLEEAQRETLIYTQFEAVAYTCRWCGKHHIVFT